MFSGCCSTVGRFWFYNLRYLFFLWPEDGLEELADDLNSSKIMYAVVKVIDPNTTRPKIVLINWVNSLSPLIWLFHLYCKLYLWGALIIWQKFFWEIPNVETDANETCWRKTQVIEHCMRHSSRNLTYVKWKMLDKNIIAWKLHHYELLELVHHHLQYSTLFPFLKGMGRSRDR